MLEEGVYAIGFYYPVVPKGEARIRVQLSAAHTRAHWKKHWQRLKKLEKRLRSRHTESEEDIRQGLQKASREIEVFQNFDQIILNANLAIAQQHATMLVSAFIES